MCEHGNRGVDGVAVGIVIACVLVGAAAGASVPRSSCRCRSGNSPRPPTSSWMPRWTMSGPSRGPMASSASCGCGSAATWKGRPESAVYVRLAGGRLGRTETRVTGVPAPEPGDRLAWFLVAHPRGGYSVLGLHQGALRVVTGPDGKARVLAPARLAGRRGRRRARPAAPRRPGDRGPRAGWQRGGTSERSPARLPAGRRCSRRCRPCPRPRT